MKIILQKSISYNIIYSPFANVKELSSQFLEISLSYLIKELKYYH